MASSPNADTPGATLLPQKAVTEELLVEKIKEEPILYELNQTKMENEGLNAKQLLLLETKSAHTNVIKSARGFSDRLKTSNETKKMTVN